MPSPCTWVAGNQSARHARVGLVAPHRLRRPRPGLNSRESEESVHLSKALQQKDPRDHRVESEGTPTFLLIKCG